MWRSRAHPGFPCRRHISYTPALQSMQSYLIVSTYLDNTIRCRLTSWVPRRRSMLASRYGQCWRSLDNSQQQLHSSSEKTTRTCTSLNQPVDDRLPERDRRSTIRNHRSPSSHPPGHSPTLAECLKLTHCALVWRTAPLSRILLTILVDNIEVRDVSCSLESIDNALCACPAFMRVVRFEPVHLVHFAVHAVWMPEATKIASWHAVWAH